MHGAHADDAVRQRRPERVRELHRALPLGARHGAAPGHVTLVAPDGRRDVLGRGRERRRLLQVLVDAPRLLHRAAAAVLWIGPLAARRRGVVVLLRGRRRRRWSGDHDAQRQIVGVLYLGLDRASCCNRKFVRTDLAT